VKELKGFARLVLEPGQEQEATVTLDRRAFAFFDVTKQDWVVEPGEFRIWVGSSAQEMRLEGKLVTGVTR
jgi:beta-glucosidase